MTNLNDTDKVAIYWSEGEHGKTYSYKHGGGWTKASLVQEKPLFTVKDVKELVSSDSIFKRFLNKGNLFVIKDDDWENNETIKVKDLLNKQATIVSKVLKETHWIKKINKTASENNLTAEQQEKVNTELDNSTISFQELAHQMSPVVKASVEDIYQYLLNEKSYWQYKHRIQ